MLLGEKQELFAQLFARLVLFGVAQGYTVVIDEVARGLQQAEWNANHCQRCKRARGGHTGAHPFKPIGILESLHRYRLAGDLLLFQRSATGKRVYLQDSKDYAVLGGWWVKQHALARWGGNFAAPDGGHFSITHGGRS